MLFKRPCGISWLVVFLGNPGTKYEMTRHNAGFMAGDAMAKAQGAAINRSRFKALTGTCDIGGETVMLMKPQTFMNLSGEAVAQAVSFYKLAPDHVIVVSDEVALPIGKLRIRTKGSAGGTTALKISSRCSAPISSRGSVSASAPRRTLITTWPTGCCPASRARTRRTFSPQPHARPRLSNATSPRARIAP